MELRERISHAPARIAEAFTSADNSGAASVLRFTALQLTVARCEATMREWSTLYWFFRGDRVGVDFTQPEARAAFIAQFGQWLYANEVRCVEWEQSGLSFDDLFLDGQMVEALL
jgi:hypothetical protein